MKPRNSWIVFSLVRIGVFAASLTALMLLGVNPWVSALAAAVIGFCVSYIFLRGPRDAVSTSIAEARASKNRDDENELENEALDRRESGL